ncbi:MAG: dTDP-4-dehydrorhamnose 3,5-epimerase [Burkholderiaceae bacterium]|nr:dTDP-4-dehydrorhamnose 3,5-epimerase [Burkholderiaceae bacterium]
MKFTRLAIPGVVLIEPRIFGDERGFFFESWNRAAFQAGAGLDAEFVQDSHSKSRRGVLRGLHYQLPPRAQGKLVRVIAGEVFDVAVDLRRSSPTFGSWVGDLLSAENRRQLWIPPGFAHGFLTLSASAEFVYKATETYAPGLERCIRWDDPALAIKWPLDGAPLVSGKDGAGVAFGAAECFA